MKNKGFTLVELLVSFSFIMIISVFLFQIILLVKDIFVGNGLKTEMITKQALISRKLNDSFLEDGVIAVSKCGNNCLNFVFSDGSVNRLQIDRVQNTFTYGDYTTTLTEGSEFGDIDIDVSLEVVSAGAKNNAFMYLTIPIKHKQFPDEDFGVNVVYQYDVYTTRITNIVFEDSPSSTGYILLKGDANVYTNSSIYNDPGFLLYDEAGNLVMNPKNVEVKNPLLAYTRIPNGEYEIEYNLLDDNGAVLYSIKRRIVVELLSSDFSYTGSVQTFVASKTGKYKLEVWGAQGGDSSFIGGMGGYSVGTVTLTNGTTLYVYAGGLGSSSAVSGGFNGGGNGIGSGRGGGGASDIRIGTDSLYARVIVAGGGGGSMYDRGGWGGGLIGGHGFVSGAEPDGALNRNGSGATQTAAGVAWSAGYSGSFGLGGNCSGGYSAGGGGGGWYGGGPAYDNDADSDGRGGGGGSGYIYTSSSATNYPSGCLLNSSHYLTDASLYAGNVSFLDPTGMTETGHSGNGYARISYVGS